MNQVDYTQTYFKWQSVDRPLIIRHALYQDVLHIPFPRFVIPKAPRENAKHGFSENRGRLDAAEHWEQHRGDSFMEHDSLQVSKFNLAHELVEGLTKTCIKMMATFI